MVQIACYNKYVQKEDMYPGWLVQRLFVRDVAGPILLPLLAQMRGAM